MKIKLRCVQECMLDEMPIHVNDSVSAVISDYEGIRIQEPDGVYSFPYHISDIEKYFVSDFDEEEYAKYLP